MRTICNLVVLLLGITFGACAAAEPPPGCSSGLTPTSTVPPKLPPRLHNEFSGKAQVSFVIDRTGQVKSPAIVSAEWHPIGRSRGQPAGYNEAILSAVAQWRYPTRGHPCRHQVPVEVQLADGMSSHLLHKDADGVGMVWERCGRDAEAQIAVKLSHSARVVSDICSFATLRLFSLLRAIGQPTEFIADLEQKYRNPLFDELSKASLHFTRIEYGARI